MKKLNYGALSCRLIFLVFVMTVQISAIVLHSIKSYLILAHVMNGMKLVLEVLFVCFIFRAFKSKSIRFFQLCIECAGTYLTVYFYRDFLDRIAGSIVPEKFIMVPYIVGCFISVLFYLFAEKVSSNNQLRIKIRSIIRSILFVFSLFFAAAAIYFKFFLDNNFFAAWSLLTGMLMFYIFKKQYFMAMQE